jgi:hypothetical protein
MEGTVCHPWSRADSIMLRSLRSIVRQLFDKEGKLVTVTSRT